MNQIDVSVQQGARQYVACREIGISIRTLQRWKSEDGVRVDERTQRHETPANKLTAEERQTVLEVVNSPMYAHLPPSQIVPMLADEGRYIASESTLYRILREEGMLAHRRSERPAKVRAKPRAFCATGPNQLYSWDITYRTPSQRSPPTGG